MTAGAARPFRETDVFINDSFCIVKYKIYVMVCGEYYKKILF